MSKASTNPAKGLLDPKNHILALIDFQSQMAFAVQSIDLVLLRNNTALLAKTAQTFRVPTVLTTVAAKSFSGPMFSEILDVFPSQHVIDRTTMNMWEDANVISEINKLHGNRIVFAGLWTSVCIAEPALCALDQGYEVYIISDACGDITIEAHTASVQRMIQAGAYPLTSLTYLLELQRDWGRTQTYNATMEIARKHGGSYGIGIEYAENMFGAKEGKKEKKTA